MNYTLRPATGADYDFLYRLHVATMRDYVDAIWGWDDKFQQRYFADHFEPHRRQIIVKDGRDAGVLQLEDRDGDLFVGLIEIAPAYQGQGLGTRVLQDVLARARAEKRPVSLHVLKSNPRARRLYERLGFRVVETWDERYVMRMAPR